MPTLKGFQNDNISIYYANRLTPWSRKYKLYSTGRQNLEDKYWMLTATVMVDYFTEQDLGLLCGRDTANQYKSVLRWVVSCRRTMPQFIGHKRSLNGLISMRIMWNKLWSLASPHLTLVKHLGGSGATELSSIFQGGEWCPTCQSKASHVFIKP